MNNNNNNNVDLLFCYSMYLRCLYILFYISAIFTLISFLLSLSFIIYWIYRWRIATVTKLYRLTEYLHKYSLTMILLTIVGDFYACVLLVQSKLFCLEVFNFPLKQIEQDQLIVYKFICRTLFENLPLAIVQMIYIGQNSGNTIPLVVLLSLTLTILSLISSISFFVSRAINVKVKYSQHVSQITEYETKFTVSCSKFRQCHAFTNKKLCEELTHAIRISDEKNGYWIDRQDVSIINDVYFIESRKSTTKEIVVYFTTTLRLYADDKEFGGTVASKLAQTINDIGKNQSEIQKIFLKSIVSRMKLSNDGINGRMSLSRIKISNLKITKNETSFLHEKIQRININQDTNMHMPQQTRKSGGSSVNNLAQYLDLNGNENENENENDIIGGTTGNNTINNTDQGLGDGERFAIEAAIKISDNNNNDFDKKDRQERLLSGTETNGNISVEVEMAGLNVGDTYSDNRMDSQEGQETLLTNGNENKDKNENDNEYEAEKGLVGESVMGDDGDDGDDNHLDYVKWEQNVNTNDNRTAGEKSGSHYLESLD